MKHGVRPNQSTFVTVIRVVLTLAQTYHKSLAELLCASYRRDFIAAMLRRLHDAWPGI